MHSPIKTIYEKLRFITINQKMSLNDALWGANFIRLSDIWTNTGFLIMTLVITIFLLCICFLIHSGIFKKIEGKNRHGNSNYVHTSIVMKRNK